MPAFLRRHLSIVLTTLACHAALAQGAPAGQPQLDLPRTTLTAGMHRIDAQLASSPAQRQIGLMHRKDMPTHEGMLFSFEEPGVQCFWMKNTLIPLTAAFVADDGTIVNLADMQPLQETSHCSAKPVRYVLEMNQGWFAQRHVKAGHRLGGGPFSKSGPR
ncbi:MAG TPA: DUF192 domain-containing protein [Ottowia sp.]|jgi:uncharacterized membrane protein (UPF0127 family)|nr:DUF192 domain-containing protein [Ottowia sp.]HMT16562.1 DUF192 domain-containing protein [Ottowia sp.]HMT59178.1 DUF192 domain-containing protein [Ottowia sp.]HMT65938.1 DUF192 domain-containing protein [Ottowia sp.]HMT84260.1 DUF192 domain-containing protein [Ottowia sp.]